MIPYAVGFFIFMLHFPPMNHQQVKVNPKYTIFHMESSLCFVNAVQFRKKLMAVSGVEAIRGSAKKVS